MFVISCLHVEYYLCYREDSGAVVWCVAESVSRGRGTKVTLSNTYHAGQSTRCSEEDRIFFSFLLFGII